MQNLLNSAQQYDKPQTRPKEIKKCLDEGLEPTYHFSIFNYIYQTIISQKVLLFI